jgi:hypothetical protein
VSGRLAKVRAAATGPIISALTTGTVMLATRTTTSRWHSSIRRVLTPRASAISGSGGEQRPVHDRGERDGGDAEARDGREHVLAHALHFAEQEFDLQLDLGSDSSPWIPPALVSGDSCCGDRRCFCVY